MAGTVQTFLKILIGASTKGFKKDMDDGEKAVRHFASETKGALDSFAEVFGVDLDDARRRTKSFSDGLGTMVKGFKASAVGTTGLTQALRVLKTALLASGVGALVLALSALAVYFTKTEQGSKQLASGMAQIKAVGEKLIDHFAKLGEGVLNLAVGKFKKAGENFKEAFTGIGDKINNARAMAKDLAQSVYDLTYEEMRFNEAKSEQIIQLEEYRLKAKDIELSAKERLANLEAAAKIEKRINAQALDIAAQKMFNAQQALKIDDDDIDLKKALSEATVNYNTIKAESIAFERGLTREKNALIKAMRSELEAIKEANELSKIPIANKTFGIKADTSTLKPSMLKDVEQGSALMQVMGQVAVDATTEINSSFANAAVGVGEFFGALANGQGGMQSFGTLVGGVFADMAINVGKIAIGAGMAVLGIKEALMTLNPWVAIGAGTILVGLGTAVKGALANASAGSGAATTLATGGSGGGGGVLYDTRTAAVTQKKQYITIKGEFVQQGRALVAVIDQEVELKSALT